MTSPLLHLSVLDAIGADIVAGHLPPGAALTLEQLQLRYKASRGLVRECMRILETMGMLRSQRRTGIEVLPQQSWNVRDPVLIRWRLEGPYYNSQLTSLTELRLGLEPVAARLAAIRATTEERDELREICAVLRLYGEAGRSDKHLDADLRFHTLILQATHNEMYSSMSSTVREMLIARRKHGLIENDDIPAALERHDAVMRAIVAGDEQEAENAMHILLDEVRAAVVKKAPSGSSRPRPQQRS